MEELEANDSDLFTSRMGNWPVARTPGLMAAISYGMHYERGVKLP
jgi:hypothetical protein